MVNEKRALALRLLEILEQYHCENACLRLLLKQTRVPNWPHKLKGLLDDSTIMSDVLEQLGPIRREIMKSSDPDVQLDILAKCLPIRPRRRQ